MGAVRRSGAECKRIADFQIAVFDWARLLTKFVFKSAVANRKWIDLKDEGPALKRSL